MDHLALEELRGSIADAIDKLDDMILALLRDAVAAGERVRPAAERRLVRARNALQRAAGLLLDDEDAEP